MKKFLALIISAIVLTVNLAGCGTAVQLNQSVEDYKFKEPISSLVKAFKDKKYIEDKSTVVEMTPVTQENNKGDEKEYGGYLEIGAVEGYRFTTTYNESTINLELYRYNTDKLDSTAKNIINSVKKDGKFKLENSSDAVDAYLSKDETFLMIYQDNSTDEKNTNRKKKVISFFEDYKK
ncbi:MAG: hypothetical protein IJV39_06675 [Ruminococcus sp.]|nr:hypothetical protein [Ruminococcus sp.]